jgi:hypothetical protein
MLLLVRIDVVISDYRCLYLIVFSPQGGICIQTHIEQYLPNLFSFDFNKIIQFCMCAFMGAHLRLHV